MDECRDPDYGQFLLLNTLSESKSSLYREINLFEVLRNDIGLKLARAFRARQDPERFAIEGGFDSQFAGRWIDFSNVIGQDLKKFFHIRTPGLMLGTSGKKKIFFQQSTKLKRVAEQLGSRDDVASLSNKRKFARWATWAPVVSFGDLVSSRRTAAAYAVKIKENLLAYGADILEQDLPFLEGDVVKAVFNINQAYRCLHTYRPDLVIVGGDNFLPPIALVLAARNSGIPTLCLQHGLDCERFFHEQIYSDYFCAWGEARAERCRQNSRYQPREIFVTGCPEFDDIRPVRDSARRFDHWLWLTRPHEPEKCMEPSRYPDEGEAIFKALLDSFASFGPRKLVVKAHPRDDTSLYKALVEKSDLKERIFFMEGRGGIYDLIREADLVFSEDSTSGMEAMFFGKAIIHTHFSAAPPSLPFVEYGAALPGYSLADIKSSLDKLSARSSEMENLMEGQKCFLKDYAGPLDGNATCRFSAVIDDILGAQ